MLILSRLAQWLLGSAAMPLMVVGLLFAGGKVIEARRAQLIQQGEAKCNAEWEIEALRVQRDAALADARASRAQANATDVLNMEIKTNAADIQKELASAKASLAAIADADTSKHCISDSVRDLARGAPGSGGGEGRTGGAGSKRR